LNTEVQQMIKLEELKVEAVIKEEYKNFCNDNNID